MDLVRGGVFSEQGPLRPDLPVPLPPAGGVAAAMRYGLTALREPAFEAAHRRSSWLVLVSVVLVAAGQLVVVGSMRESVTSCGVALAAYTALRTATLMALQRQQYAFEPVWLAERSAALRAANFEVVRCGVGDRTYDLTDPDAVADLLRRPDAETTVLLDITYPPRALERAHRRLGDVDFVPMLRPGMRARARFLDARYEMLPSGSRTYWLLGGPVALTVAQPADPATPRAETGSTGRPDAVRRVDERPRGRT
ncbi:hypothetical protein AB0I53_13670 [Saccharopolyspora sp. NPDC050389]|uniref:hypothetical protein n=1 Tax=Saccharopolyspora sp. NPDC050389 TaxID=3155516 RepID=UPI0034018886